MARPMAPTAASGATQFTARSPSQRIWMPTLDNIADHSLRNNRMLASGETRARLEQRRAAFG